MTADDECVYSLARNAVERPGLVLDVGIEISPELDEEEGGLGAFVVQLLQAALLLREFVVYLPDVDRLEEGIGVGSRAPYVHEQVPVVLQSPMAEISQTIFAARSYKTEGFDFEISFQFSFN